jgi:hypothetical protein
MVNMVFPLSRATFEIAIAGYFQQFHRRLAEVDVDWRMYVARKHQNVIPEVLFLWWWRGGDGHALNIRMLKPRYRDGSCLWAVIPCVPASL